MRDQSIAADPGQCKIKLNLARKDAISCDLADQGCNPNVSLAKLLPLAVTSSLSMPFFKVNSLAFVKPSYRDP